MTATMGITDADRERVVRDLTRHCGDGRLTLDELEERIAEAYAAQTPSDLDHALRQLPVQPQPMTVTARPVTTTPFTSSSSSSSSSSSAVRSHRSSMSATKGAEIALKVHLYTWMAVIAFLVAIWFLTTPFGYFWPIWAALPWGMALGIHAGVTKAIVSSHQHELDR